MPLHLKFCLLLKLVFVNPHMQLNCNLELCFSPKSELLPLKYIYSRVSIIRIDQGPYFSPPTPKNFKSNFFKSGRINSAESGKLTVK